MPPWVDALFVITVATAAILVGSFVGARRGLKQAEDKVDQENAKLIAALTERVRLLEKSNAEKDVTIATLNSTVATLNSDIVVLRTDLETERRLTVRLGLRPDKS
jgi:uncharacterized coiled-coil protein SlyX